MPIDLISFNGISCPAWQATGNASRFIIPFALEVCKGVGYDLGCNREEWKLPNAMAWDISIEPRQDALKLPELMVDFIFSSHCLEHLPNWVDALEHWGSRLKSKGVLFLYLPHYDSQYWRSWNNRKHIHNLNAETIIDYLKDRAYKNIFSTGVDLNNSFAVIAEK